MFALSSSGLISTVLRSRWKGIWHLPHLPGTWSLLEASKLGMRNVLFFFSFLSSITLSFLVPDHVSQAKKGSVSNNIGVDRSFNQEYIFPRRVASRLFLPWRTSEVGFLLCLGQGWSSQWHTDLTQQIHFSTSNPMSANGVTQLF